MVIILSRACWRMKIAFADYNKNNSSDSNFYLFRHKIYDIILQLMFKKFYYRLYYVVQYDPVSTMRFFFSL